MGEPQEGQPSSTQAEPVSDAAVSLLVEAGAVLASSLDPTTTMGQVARLTVPRLADLCVIDLLDDDGSIRDVAVAASRPGDRTSSSSGCAATYPLDPEGEHPVARVIRSGEPELLAEMTSMLLQLLRAGLGACAVHDRPRLPLGGGGAAACARRTLGALSVLRLGDGTP